MTLWPFSYFLYCWPLYFLTSLSSIYWNFSWDTLHIFLSPSLRWNHQKKKKKHRAPNQWDLDFGNGPWIKVESLDREHLLFCLLLNRIFNFHFHPGSLLVEECQHLWFKKEESKEKKDRKAKMIPINAIPLRTVYL